MQSMPNVDPAVFQLTAISRALDWPCLDRRGVCRKNVVCLLGKEVVRVIAVIVLPTCDEGMLLSDDRVVGESRPACQLQRQYMDKPVYGDLRRYRPRLYTLLANRVGWVMFTSTPINRTRLASRCSMGNPVRCSKGALRNRAPDRYGRTLYSTRTDWVLRRRAATINISPVHAKTHSSPLLEQGPGIHVCACPGRMHKCLFSTIGNCGQPFYTQEAYLLQPPMTNLLGANRNCYRTGTLPSDAVLGGVVASWAWGGP